MHRTAVAALRVPEQEERVPSAQIAEAHPLTPERRELERRRGCSDRDARIVEHVGHHRLDRLRVTGGLIALRDG